MQKHSLIASGSMAAIVAVALTLPLSAMAQTPPATPEQVQSSFPDIIVTANKRSQSVQDIAGAVTGIGNEDMQLRGINSLDAVTQAAPGMTFYTQSGSTFITLRGVGVPVDTGASDPNTVVSFDGVNLPRAGEATIDLFDVERVEVARGPQGTLYGRNAIGGAINFIGRAPTDHFSAQINAGYGNYETYKVNGTLSGPIAEGISVRLSAAHSERNKGFVKNLYDGSRADEYENSTFRAAIHAERGDWQMDVSALSHYEKFLSYQQIMAGVVSPPGSVHAPSGSGTQIPISDIPGIQYSVKPWEFYSSFVHPSRKRVRVFSLRNTFDLGNNIQLKSTTGLVRYKFHSSLDGTAVVPTQQILPAPEDGLPFGRTQPSKSFSQEITLGGSFGEKGNWVIGGYFSDEKFRVNIPIYLNTGLGYTSDPANSINDIDTSISFDARYRERTTGIFADVTVPVSARFRVYGGARYAQEVNKAHYESKLTAYPYSYADRDNPGGGELPPGTLPFDDGCAALTGGAVSNADKFDFKWHPFTPRLGAQYDVSDDIMVYGQWSKGFKVGGTAATQCGNTYGPERLTAWETGFKSVLFDGHLVANLAAYYYDYSGMQIYQGVGAAVARVVNADARTLGLDIELRARFNDILSADLSGSILKAEFHDFASTDASDPSNINGLPTVDIDGVATPNLDGHRLPGVPDYNFTAGLQADIPLGGFFNSVMIRGEGNFVGKADITGWERPENMEKAYVKLNAVIALRTDDGLTFRLWARNLTNKATTFHYLWNAGPNVWSGQYSPPRTYGVEFVKDF
jgi:iron complex outermembrane receptor protein